MAQALYAARGGPAGAPIVMLLHPMGHCGTIWDRHLVSLSERFRVIAPDLPGHGRSEGPFTVSASADAVAALIGAQDQPVHLAGLSLGARIALSVAATGTPLASLTLVGCGLSPFTGGRVLTRALPPIFFSNGASKATVLASMAELAVLDLRPCLPRVSVRTLVAVGEKDRPYLDSAREIAAAIDGARLRVIPGGGHLWPKKQPSDFAGMLTDWVAASPAPAAD